jgi:radical SAM/Cys-rich protein
MFSESDKPDFAGHLEMRGQQQLKADGITTLQVNLGKLCNQACKHCHVDAGPGRKEIMLRETSEKILQTFLDWNIPTLDITGGAPELNPSFRMLVEAATLAGRKVIVRHNLTVQFEAGQEDLPDFFARNSVELVSSLPYFLSDQTDAQRGRGVFQKSIEALKILNAHGYGICDAPGALNLHLAYNPTGAFLPPSQKAIEADFKQELLKRYGIAFNRLFVITNMPISRFQEYLKRSGNEAAYWNKLLNAFNADTLEGLMCRTMISVDWEGHIFDCDFNQMLDMPVGNEEKVKFWASNKNDLLHRPITTDSHCFGCTAGGGSSCGGSLVNQKIG